MNRLQFPSFHGLRVGMCTIICLLLFVGLAAGVGTAAQDHPAVTVTDNPTAETEFADIHTALDHVADSGDVIVDDSYDSAAEPTYPIVVDQPVTIKTDADDPATVATPSDTEAAFVLSHSDVQLSSLHVTHTDTEHEPATGVIVKNSDVTLSGLTINADELLDGGTAVEVAADVTATDITVTDTVIDGAYSTGIAVSTTVDGLTIQDSQFAHHGETAVMTDPATGAMTDVTLSGNEIGADLSVALREIDPEDGGLSVQANDFATDTDLTVLIDEATDTLSAVTIAENAFASSAHVEFVTHDTATGQATLAPNWWGDQYGPDITDVSALTNPQHALSPNRSVATVAASHADRIDITPWYTDRTLSTTIAPVENINSDRTYLTIQDAVNDASTSDTIQVHEGEFRSSVHIDKALNLRGVSSNSIIIGSVTIEHTDKSETTITGLHMTNSSLRGTSLVSIASPDGDIEITDSSLEGNSGSIIRATDSASLDFSDNQIHASFDRHEKECPSVIDISKSSLSNIESNAITAHQYTSNVTAIDLRDTSTVLSNNTVNGFGTGILVDGYTEFYEIDRNKLYENNIAIHLKSAFTFDLFHNKFIDSNDAGLVVSDSYAAINVNSNWWNSSDGPSLNGTGNGDRVIIEADTDAEFNDFATITDIGNLSANVELVGMDHDPAADSAYDVRFSGQNITYDPRNTGSPQPASGTIVIEIAGVEFTGELCSGSISGLTIDDPTASFDPSEVDAGDVDITIPETDLGTVSNITLLHDVYQPTETGYVPISIPQPATLHSEHTTPHTVTWNETTEQYQSVSLPINTDHTIASEFLHDGVYLHFSDPDTRYGFSYVTHSEETVSSTDVSLDEGWNLISTNYDITGATTVSLGEDIPEIDIPKSDAGYSDSDVVFYAVNSAQRLYADSTISSHEVYWAYVEDATAVDNRTIHAPIYDPDPGG